MDNGSEDGIRVDAIYENRERKDSNSERKTVRFNPEPQVVYLDLDQVFDPAPRAKCLVRRRVLEYQMDMMNRSNGKPPLPPRNRVDPLVATAEMLEQPLPPTPPPSTVIKVINPNPRPRARLNGQLSVTSRGVQHYRRDPAFVNETARGTAAGTQLGNAALPTRFYRAVSMNSHVPPRMPIKTKMPPPPPPPLQPKPSILKTAVEVAVQEEPKPSTSKTAVEVAVQVEPNPSTSKAAVEVEVQEPKPSTSKTAVEVAVQVEPKPSTSKAAVKVAVQEPKPSTSKTAVEVAVLVESKPSTSKAAANVRVQVEPTTNGQAQSDGKKEDNGEKGGSSDKKHKGKCKIRNGRCKKCERAAGQQADDNNHDGRGTKCLLFTIQCLGCGTM